MTERGKNINLSVFFLFILYTYHMPTINSGVVHDIPADLTQILESQPAILEKWNSLTPLARNEWICWVISVSKPETRTDHLRRLQEELTEGKRRPCCWPGCPHRNQNARKWFKKLA